MRILVYGAGGMGLYLAGRLAGAGYDVTLKGRASTAAAAREHGVRIRSGNDAGEATSLRVVEHLEPGGPEGPFDLAILATKAWQVAAAAAEIAPCLSGDGVVLSTQNGVSAPDDIAASVDPSSVLAGTVVVIAQKTGDLDVELLGKEAAVTLGCPAGGRPAGTAAALEALTRAGLTAVWTDDIVSALWKKLALIASYGGVGALSRATVGEMRAVPETADLVRSAIAEAVHVGTLHGARLGRADVDELMGIFTTGFSADTTASLQRDLAAGLPSEFDYQSGAVVRSAEAAGADAPVHRTIHSALLPQEAISRRESTGPAR